jgi:hypothetical protein
MPKFTRAARAVGQKHSAALKSHRGEDRTRLNKSPGCDHHAC